MPMKLRRGIIVAVLILFALCVICLVILSRGQDKPVLGNSGNIDDTVLFGGKTESWKAEYVKVDEDYGEIHIEYLFPFKNIENANIIEVQYDLGGTSGKSSLMRQSEDEVFQESQLKPVFQIPIHILQMRVQDPQVVIIVDDEQVMISLEEQ